MELRFRRFKRLWFIAIITALNLAALAFGTVNPAHAAINSQINFQGKLTNTNGTNIADGTYNLQFKLYTGGDGVVGGGDETLQWTEERLRNNSQGVTVTNGIFQVNLGSVTALPAIFNNDTIWLSINLGNTNATCTPFTSCAGDGEMNPMIRFTAAPYALNSNLLQGLGAANFVQLGQGVQTDGTTNSSIFINKTAAGNLAQLQTSGVDAFTIAANGDITLGQNANHTLSVAQVTSAGVGKNLTVAAGQSNGANAGGTLALQGGAGGTGGGGGSVTIDPGAPNGAGALGTVSIGTGGQASQITFKVTAGANSTTVTFTAPTATNAINFPNAGGTLCTTTASTCNSTYAPGTSASYIQNQSSLQSSSNFHISGTGTADTSLSTPTLTTVSGDLLLDPTGDTVIRGSVATNATAALNVTNSTPTSLLFVRNDGNVGIGTTGPDSTLHLIGGLCLETSDTGCAAGSGQLVVNSTGANGLLRITDTSATARDVLTIADGGATTFRNQTDSTAAFQVQSAASGTDVLMVDTTNSQLSVRGINSNATLGSEKVTNGTFTGNATGWTLGTGWAYNSNNVTKTAGSASDLEQNVSAATGETYEVVFTISSWTAGCLTPKIGGQDGYAVCANSTSQTQLITAINTANLKLSANSTFAGTIDNVSVKKVTFSNSVISLKSDNGIPGLEIRSGGSDAYENVFIGTAAGRSNQFDSFFGYGLSNTGVGARALQNNTTGKLNTALGSSALSSNTIGSNNIALGFQAADNLTTGSNNIIIGYDIDSPTATNSNTLNIGNLLFGTGIDGTGTTLSTGNIGIGTSAPGSKLAVVGNSTAASGVTYISSITGNLSVANTGAFSGLNVNPTFSASSGNTLASLSGIVGIPQNTSTGTVSSNIGIFGNPGNTSTGTITSVYALYGRVDNTSTGTIGTAYGLYVAAPTNSGTITNKYALVTEANAGNVGIGTTAPGEKLEVVGNIISKGTSWTTRTSAADNQWQSVTYGNGLFVSVANTGTGNRVMTSPDGINWTTRTSAADIGWTSVTYGNGLFVSVANSGTGNRVMTSPDGINWTTRTSAADNQWQSVTYGNGLFVAVSNDGTGNRVMTSPDGITWTSRTSAADNNWNSVTYGNGLFVAISQSGTGNRVMTSPDGINWTTRTSAADNAWREVTYGNGLFVAVACGISATTCNSTAGNRVMTSPDGITWTSQTSAADNSWQSVVYGNGLFVAVSQDGTGNRVMTSPDGINWTTRTSAADNQWQSVNYGNGLFVSEANTGTGNRVMTSGKIDYTPFSHNNIYQGGISVLSGDALFRPATNSATSFRVQNVDASATIFDVDASNQRVGIGTTSPQATLHVMRDSTDALLTITDSTGTDVDVLNIADEGATTFKNRTDSANAFKIQNTAGNEVLAVETSGTASANLVNFGKASTLGGQLKIHGSTSGNVIIAVPATVTSYTLTLPANDGNNGECLKTDGSGTTSWGSCGSGGGSSRVVLVPEYPGAVMTGDGSANSGTMTSDFCSKTAAGIPADTNTGICVSNGDRHNYYSWTSQSGDNDYDIYVRYQLTAATANATSTFNVYGWRTDSTNNTVDVSLYNASGTQCGATTNVATGTAAWTETAIGSVSGDTDCTMSSNDVVTFKIHMVATGADFARVGEIRIDY